jgi:hypothetical protein
MFEDLTMREDKTSRLFARCYGLALGLALGAFVGTVPTAWRDAAAATCWMADAEAGLVPGAGCPALSGFGAAADGSAGLDRPAAAGSEPQGAAARSGEGR